MVNVNGTEFNMLYVIRNMNTAKELIAKNTAKELVAKKSKYYAN